jgi:magnesium transporter
VIEARHFRTHAAPVVIRVDDISELHPERFTGTDELLWVDLAEPSPDDLHQVAEEFSLHPLALEGAIEVGERTKLDRYPTHEFLVLYDSTGTKIAVFVGTCWIISVRMPNTAGRLVEIDALLKRFTENDTPTAGWFSYFLLDELVDGYEAGIDALEDRVELLEDRIVAADGLNKGGFESEVLETRRALLGLRRIVLPARDVLQELRRSRNPALNDQEVDIALADVHDHVLRVVEQLDAQRELLGNAFEAHLSMQSNQMNQVMKQLTAWGSIVFGATLIAGIYGMNFSHMPELSWKLGYPMALGMMALLSGGLYWVFRRRDWL